MAPGRIRRPKPLTADHLDRWGIDLNRYCVSMARSRKILQRYREERREAVRQDAGAHYSDDGPRQRVPVNLIGLYRQVMSASLISANPRLLLSTFNPQMKASVEGMMAWVNPQLVRIRAEESLRRIVNDGLYSLGIGYVALATPADAASLNWGTRAGEPLLSPVDLDDFVFDTHANRFEEACYFAHRIRVPIDAVKDSKLYDSTATKQLEPTLESRYNLEGDERISQIGKGLWWHQDDAVDMVDLWQLYLPQHRLIVTLSNDLMTGPAFVQAEGRAEPLRVQRWIGPDSGPYHLLGYDLVGGNAMPRGPILNLMDLHESANENFRKLMRQTQRQKDLLFVQGGADADGNRVMNADDGQVLKVDRPDLLKPATFGGPNQQNLAFFLQTQQLFNLLGGNLNVQGGLSPESPTLGGEKLLAANSSRLVSAYQARTLEYVVRIAKSLCWYWWHDPYRVMHAPYSPQGMPELQVPRSVHPASAQLKAQGQLTRHGPFEDLQIEVDPYSLQHQTPQERLQALRQIVTQIVIPMMPLLQQNGILFDAQKYLQLEAKYGNWPELSEILTIGQAAQPEPQGPEGMGMPNQTERKYVRENRSTRTQDGTLQSMLTALSGTHPGGNMDREGAPRVTA